MMVSIPLKYAVSQVVGYINGKSAIQIARGIWVTNAISLDNIFGPGVIMYQQLVEMKS